MHKSYAGDPQAPGGRHQANDIAVPLSSPSHPPPTERSRRINRPPPLNTSLPQFLGSRNSPYSASSPHNYYPSPSEHHPRANYMPADTTTAADAKSAQHPYHPHHPHHPHQYQVQEHPAPPAQHQGQLQGQHQGYPHPQMHTHGQQQNISMPRTRPTVSPTDDRVARFAYAGQPAPQSPGTPVVRMPVPEIPMSVQTQLARTTPHPGDPNQQLTSHTSSANSSPHHAGTPHLPAPNSAIPVGGAQHTPSPTTAKSSHVPYPLDSQAPSPMAVAAASINVPATSQINGSYAAAFQNFGDIPQGSKHRRFGSDVGIPASDLTVDQFETIRSHAATQPHDPRAQLELAKRLCEASDHLTGFYTDPTTPSTMEVDSRQQARNREAWTAQALKIAKKLATRAQFPEALFFLGSIYSSGKYSVDLDYVKALGYYHKAAKLEHAEACYRVAVCEEFGVGTRRSIEKAVMWYKKAAMLGSVGSMYKLGMLSLLGSLDQPRDFNAGLLWLQRAADKADQKNPHAVHELALLYERSPLSTYTPGDSIPHNEAKALELYYIAAKLGYPPSQARLGRAFEFGELGCSIDASWSISWYSQAAQQGDSDAELGMAGWYWTGSPQLKKNDTEAFLWAERAAGKGNPRAMYAVGYFCECGIGVHRDLKRSKNWYSLAAEKKHPRAAQKLKLME